MARSTAHEALWRVRNLIDAHYAQPLDLDELARTANFSRYHFLRAFRRAFQTGGNDHFHEIHAIGGGEAAFEDQLPAELPVPGS